MSISRRDILQLASVAGLPSATGQQAWAQVKNWLNIGAYRVMKKAFKAISVFIALTLIASFAFAQSSNAYPVKPITLIVPFPPGGVTDLVARELAKRLSEGLGQPVVVDNRAGAGGNIGTAVLARAQPDGYTLGVMTVSAM